MTLTLTEQDVRAQPQQAALIGAIQAAFRPLARVLVDQGIGARFAVDAFKRAFIQGAEDTLKERGLPTTTARLAIVTALTQVEVERLRTSVGTNAEVPASPLSSAPSLLLAWHNDGRYSNGFTGPNALPLRSTPPGLSFATLASEFAPEVDPSSFLAELVAAGSVVYDAETDLYRACERTFFFEKLSTASAGYLAGSLSHLSETLAHNFRAPDRSNRLFDRRCFLTEAVTEATEDAFGDFLKLNGQKFIDAVDEWIEKQPRAPENGRRIGVQVFQYVEDDRSLIRTDTPPGDRSSVPKAVSGVKAARRP